MDQLKELIKLSTYVPREGALSVLFQAVQSNLSEREIKLHFQDYKSQYHNTYKLLKDKLVDGIFNNSFKDYSTIAQKAVRIYTNEAACKNAFALDAKKAWRPLASETLSIAMRYGFYDVAYRLSSDLVYYYSIYDPNTEKHNFYFKKYTKAKKLFSEEMEATMAYAQLAFKVHKKRDLSDIPLIIERLDQIAPNNREFKFNLAYRLLKINWLQLQNDDEAVINECNKAIEFFKSYKNPLPYTTEFAIYNITIPIHIKRGEFSEAGNKITKALDLPGVGTYNWHDLLFYKALSGFHSNKPGIAHSTWKIAQRQAHKVPSPIISEQWQIVEAYLALYNKLGQTNYQNKWRFGKFLNDTPIATSDKQVQNVAIIIVQLLHYLVDRRYKDYMQRTEHLEQYIQQNLKGKDHTRTRNMLRILKKVEDADYNLRKFDLMTKRYVRELRKHLLRHSTNRLKSEVVPFEGVIGIVRELLR